MFNSKLTFIKPSSKDLYKQDRDFFEKLSELRKKQFLRKRHKKIKKWYRSERNDINYIFNKIMNYMVCMNIYLTISVQKFYDKFVEFCYDNSNNKII
jgi:hypothetical protein